MSECDNNIDFSDVKFWHGKKCIDNEFELTRLKALLGECEKMLSHILLQYDSSQFTGYDVFKTRALREKIEKELEGK